MKEERTQGIDAETTTKDSYNTYKKANETELLDLRAGYGQDASPTLNSKFYTRQTSADFQLSNAPASQEFYDFSINVAEVKHLVPTLETLDQHERRQFELRQFKHKLMEKYVHSDPNYQKLTQEGQAYYEQSFLAFLDFLEKTKNLELLRRKEDFAIIEKIDVFHVKQAKEIMAELDKFLKKQQVKVENAVRDGRKLEDG